MHRYHLLPIIVGFLLLTGFTAPLTTQTPTRSTWSIVPSPNVGIRDNILYGVSAVSSTNVWVVGNYRDTSLVDQPLTEHWNGTVWSVVPSSNLSNTNSNGALNILTSVSANQSTAWTVGYSFDVPGKDTPIIGRWDGTQWKAVPSPVSNGALNSVTLVPNSQQAWAVGTTRGLDGSQPLIEYYDGSVWSSISGPIISGSALFNVFALSATNIWAVGLVSLQVSGMDVPLAEHWNGKVWSRVPVPDSGNLYGITGMNNDLWAVGIGPNNALTEHYNGKIWKTASSSTGTPTDLLAAAALNHSRVYAVGRSGNVASSELWNGSVWKTVSMPYLDTTDSELFGATSVPNGKQIWAVGFANINGIDKTLIERTS